jgi:multisubunit Na+/H+ antiporter MnhB subunit
MVALIAIGAIVLEAIGRSQDVVTACITTAVVLVVAGIAPQHAWKQPILRLIDTIVGTLVGVAGAWIAHKMPRFISFSETPFSIPRKPNHGTSQRTDHSVDEVH